MAIKILILVKYVAKDYFNIVFKRCASATEFYFNEEKINCNDVMYFLHIILKFKLYILCIKEINIKKKRIFWLTLEDWLIVLVS